MHERSLVKAVIEQACEEQRLRGLGRIVEIQLEIGEFSGVDSTLFESAFAEMAMEYWGRRVGLRIESVSLIAECDICRKEFAVERFHFFCPNCQSGDITLKRGEDIRMCQMLIENSQSLSGASG